MYKRRGEFTSTIHRGPVNEVEPNTIREIDLRGEGRETKI